MSKKINLLTICYVIFLVLLLASGFLTGVLSEAVYLLSFILPIALVLFLSRNEKTERGRYLSISREGIKQTLPLVFPTVSVVIITSFLTSLLIFFISGKTNNVNIGTSFIGAIISHAVLPAILEEALFRYLPLRLLAPYSKRGAVLVSAFFFALIHRNFFTIPYAFIAGVIFMTIDLAADSVIPSVIIHFINNALSVGMIIYGDNPAFAPVIYSILGVLTIVSVFFIILKRIEYKDMLSSAFEKGEGVKITSEMLIFAAMTLTLALLNIL